MSQFELYSNYLCANFDPVYGVVIKYKLIQETNYTLFSDKFI